MKTYSEKLRDPRWQKRRLEILQRDDWTCCRCGKKDQELHVHHTWYSKDCKPWDYPDETLVTLCISCHAHVTNMISDAQLYMHEKDVDEAISRVLQFHQDGVLSNVLMILEQIQYMFDLTEETMKGIYATRSIQASNNGGTVVASGENRPA